MALVDVDVHLIYNKLTKCVEIGAVDDLEGVLVKNVIELLTQQFFAANSKLTSISYQL
jgi:hypothetical protein